MCSVLCWGWAATLAEARQRVGRDVCFFPMLCVELFSRVAERLPRFRKRGKLRQESLQQTEYLVKSDVRFRGGQEGDGEGWS